MEHSSTIGGTPMIEYVPFIASLMAFLMVLRAVEHYQVRYFRSLQASPELKKARQEAALAALSQRKRDEAAK